MAKIKHGPRGGKYMIVNGKKRYLTQNESNNLNYNRFGFPCVYSDNQPIPGLPQFSWHNSWCRVNGARYLHVTAFYNKFRGMSDEPPSVHVGYRPQDIHLGPVLWSSPGWIDFQNSEHENQVVQFITNQFNSVPNPIR